MKIFHSGIEFDNPKEFSSFVFENNLLGLIQLSEPIKDNTDKILIKEFVSVKENAIKKLETMVGQYQPIFKVHINSDLTNKINQKLCKEFISIIEEGDDYILKQLFMGAETAANYKGVIANALQSKYLVLTMFRLWLEKREFFKYITHSALLALGIAYNISVNLKMLYRYSFISGLLLDMILSEVDYWKEPLGGEALMAKLAAMSGDIASNIELPAPICTAVRQQYTPGMYSDTVPSIDFLLLSKNPFLQPIERSKEPEDSPSNAPESEKKEPISKDEEAYNLQLTEMLTEVCKLTKFIKESTKKIPENKEHSEALITMLVYNVEKGVFKKNLADPVINNFKKYDKLVKQVRRIAQVEKKCPHPPSAWAYPKPFATQILCKNRIDTCYNYTRGWDLTVVASQEALGYIGTPLMPGNYPKCKLEQYLDEIIRG